MDELTKKLLFSTDAQVWAQAFMETVVEDGVEIDEGLMIGWFANAIEVAREAGYERGCDAGYYVGYNARRDSED